MANTLISIVTMLAALGPGSEPSAPCNESIRQQDLKADLYFLASDAFQGRLTGTAGNNLAAEFIASRFERLGLKRMGSDTCIGGAWPAGGLCLRGAAPDASRSDRRGPQHGHDRPQPGGSRGGRPSLPRSGDPVGGIEPQRIESSGPQLMSLAHADDRAVKHPLRPDAQAGSRQQRVQSPAPQRPLAFPAARGPGGFHSHRLAPRLPHSRGPPRKDRVRQDGTHRSPGSSGKLGPSPASRPPETRA
jgi:hypothetical protein